MRLGQREERDVRFRGLAFGDTNSDRSRRRPLITARALRGATGPSFVFVDFVPSCEAWQSSPSSRSGIRQCGKQDQ